MRDMNVAISPVRATPYGRAGHSALAGYAAYDGKRALVRLRNNDVIQHLAGTIDMESTMASYSVSIAQHILACDAGTLLGTLGRAGETYSASMFAIDEPSLVEAPNLETALEQLLIEQE